MSQSVRNFTPGGTVSLAVTSSSGNVAMASSPSSRKDIMIYNSGSEAVFIKFGNSAVTAATTDMPIPAGAWGVFHAGDTTHVAGISASGNLTLYATTGFGN